MTALIAIGTAKGLFLARSEDGRGSWQISTPHHQMTEVYSVAIDTRRATPRVLAGMIASHFGPSVATSDDLGETWQEPDPAPIAFPEGTEAAVERVWQLTPGPASQPDRVYAGTQPSALWSSDDGGMTYQLVQALWDHPHRPTWGAGFGGQAIHTILPHPTDPASILVAMSTGGVYRSSDGGASWAPSNTGIRVLFQPEEYPEYGQCVHKVARDPVHPERLYLQNHGGVYRSDDGGGTWQSIADGLPSDFGFAMVSHPRQPDVIYNFPLEADIKRFPVGRSCQVYRSQDAGKSWEALRTGLPGEGFYPTVLRDAMCVDNGDPAGVYFGTRSGEVYGSRDAGDTWSLVAAHLPAVLSVRAADF
ncbi:MAG: exo-alpha-sialidase [Micromonosporaceae bacterium]|nr:exo-alpha-sialidase [Micromonosporaceae bacterium]